MNTNDFIAMLTTDTQRIEKFALAINDFFGNAELDPNSKKEILLRIAHDSLFSEKASRAGIGAVVGMCGRGGIICAEQ